MNAVIYFFTSQYLNIYLLLSTTELVFLGCVKLFLSNTGTTSRRTQEVHYNTDTDWSSLLGYRVSRRTRGSQRRGLTFQLRRNADYSIDATVIQGNNVRFTRKLLLKTVQPIQSWSSCDESLVHSNKSTRRRRRHGKHCVPENSDFG